MSDLASRRLAEASSSLPAAERALLNLWTNRGLDDSSLAAMTGVTIDAIAARRTRIVEHLSEKLGLPQAEIDAALTEIAATSGAELAATSAGERSANSAPPDANGQPRVVASTPPAEPALVPPAEPVAAPVAEGESVPRRRRALWAVIGALAVLLAIVVIIAAGAGGGPHRRASTGAAVSTTTATPTETLGTLPGTVAHAHGSVMRLGTRGDLKLKLSVMALPAPARGYYEVWLFNSILDSRPLARLNAGGDHVVIALPPGSQRYRWIDISFQPAGFVNHSGESVLRAANPVAIAGRG